MSDTEKRRRLDVAISPRRRAPASPRLDWIAITIILIVAAFLRFQGLDWDKGYLFHPDERQILMVSSRLNLPQNPLDFFSVDSPLNPKFFSYGTFPIYLLRLLGAFVPAVDYAVPWRDNILVSYALLGRTLSALFDLGTIALIFLLARRLYDARIGLLAAASVAVTVLHIQLSHFYTVDTVLTFFVVATMYFAARYAETARVRDAIAMSIACGLAMAAKISAAPLVVPMTVAVVQACKWQMAEGRGQVAEGGTAARSLRHSRSAIRDWLSAWRAEIWDARKMLSKTVGIALAVFFLAQPYALLDPLRFFGQTGSEALIVRGWMDVPYTRQYLDTPPFLYQIAQSSVWGMGLPLGAVAWLGGALFVWRWWQSRTWRDGFLCSWGLVYFFAIGGQHAKHLRYLLPLIPFVYLMAAAAITNYQLRITHTALRLVYSGVLLTAFVYAFSFAGIYSRDHPWFAISRWIYANASAGAIIALEHWDDNLPVSMRAPGPERLPTEYQLKTLPMYDADDDTKLQLVADTLATSDYVILATQRLYGTIPRLPARYPVSSRYYARLFSGELGFELTAFARNDPRVAGIAIADNALRDAGLPVPTVLASYFASAWDWGKADESFTVYDHPMPLVFKKARPLTRDEIAQLLSR